MIETKKPILVTGATGYLASWIVKKLLLLGHSVNCAVRDPNNKDKIAHLVSLERKGEASLQFFKADLLVENSYDEAMKGCEIVIHTASPFFYDDSQDAQSALVDPAVNGTANVLNSANRSESIKRVVLTSSVASLFGDTKDALKKSDHTMNEQDWNTTSSLTNGPYSYSKVMAEKKAWEIHDAQKQWDLVVINPSWIIGPSVNPNASFESKKIFKQVCNGTMALGCPNLEIGMVDVRDVAQAHINAIATDVKSARYIVSAQNKNMLDLGIILRKRVGGLLFPRFFAPKPILWLIAPLAGFTREYISKNVGYPIKFDNSKGIDALGLDYRDLDQTVTDFYHQLYS